MDILICNYLRLRGLNVVEECSFKGFEMIDKYRPKIFLIANGAGAILNFNLVKYASLKGIKVVTLVSEGNFRENKLASFYWGWNKEQVMYEDINMQWSERTKKMITKEYTNIAEKIKVSGGVGFDYYKIVCPCNKKDFLIKFGKEHYEKIIGIGCWDFSPNFSKDPRYIDQLNNHGEAVIARFRNDRDSFNKILIEIIKNNQDILFILKEHPGNIWGYDMSGIEGCEKYSNALILKREPIADCIAVSDFWLTYESTTVIEAWMLNKQTCLLNPSGIDFPRANVYMGSPNYPDTISFQNAINIFYMDRTLPGFKELQIDRDFVTKETIQWDDGLNHVRAGNEIIRLLEDEKNKDKRKTSLNLQIKKWKQFFLSRGFPIKKTFTYHKLKEFDEDALHGLTQSVYNQQIIFYTKNGLSMDDLKNIRAE
jgi:hypothetical protein